MIATKPADRAWGMINRAEDPMPVSVAVDWLRQEMNTDDVAAVKQALYDAASSWLYLETDEGYTPFGPKEYLAEGNIEGLSLWVRGYTHTSGRSRIDLWAQRVRTVAKVRRRIEKT